MSYRVTFFQGCAVGPDGVSHPAVVGVGPDQTLWVEPEPMGLTPADVARMDAARRPTVLVAHELRRVFVNAQVVADNMKCPENRRRMQAHIDSLLDRLHPTNFRK
jgi:hypothetical protein